MVRESVLQALAAPSLRVYLVWVPMLSSDTLASARESAARVIDPRARQYWDPELRLAHSLGRTLALPPDDEGAAAAWDVYLVYPAKARWGEAGPPPPAAWMHQLGRVADTLAPKLDGDGLRALVAGVLE